MLPPPPDDWDGVFYVEHTASRSSVRRARALYASAIVEIRNEQAGRCDDDTSPPLRAVRW
jgi:hypothetical protein